MLGFPTLVCLLFLSGLGLGLIRIMYNGTALCLQVYCSWCEDLIVIYSQSKEEKLIKKAEKLVKIWTLNINGYGSLNSRVNPEKLVTVPMPVYIIPLFSLMQTCIDRVQLRRILVHSNIGKKMRMILKHKEKERRKLKIEYICKGWSINERVYKVLLTICCPSELVDTARGRSTN